MINNDGRVNMLTINSSCTDNLLYSQMYTWLVSQEQHLAFKFELIWTLRDELYMVAQKSKPLPDDQKMALNRIEACQ